VHSPSQSPSQPPGRVLRLIIVLPVSLLRSPCRHCVSHVVASFCTSSLPSHRRRRVGWLSLSVLWSSLALAWLHCPCPEFPGTSIDGRGAVAWGRGGRPRRWLTVSAWGSPIEPSSYPSSSCGLRIVLIPLLAVVDPPFLLIDYPRASSSIPPSSSSSSSSSSSTPTPTSLIPPFLPSIPLVVAVDPPPPSLSLCPHIGLLPHGSPSHLSPSSVRPSREYEPAQIPLERGEAASSLLSGLGRYQSGPHPSKEGRGS